MSDDTEDPLESDAVRSAESAYAEMCIAREREEAEDRMRDELARTAEGNVHVEPLITLTLAPPNPDDRPTSVTITAIKTSGGKRDWSSASPEEIDAEVERTVRLTDEQVREEILAGGEDPGEVAEHTREVLLAAIAAADPEPSGYEIDGPYMEDAQTSKGFWDATVRRRKIVSGAHSRSEALAACRQDIRKIVEAYGIASVEALDEIAEICGCQQWDYPALVVRGVRILEQNYMTVIAKLQALDSVIEQYKDVQVMTMAERRMVEHYRVLVDKNRELERRVTDLQDEVDGMRTPAAALDDTLAVLESSEASNPESSAPPAEDLSLSWSFIDPDAEITVTHSTVHLTTEEQETLHASLRRSVEVVSGDGHSVLEQLQRENDGLRATCHKFAEKIRGLRDGQRLARDLAADARGEDPISVELVADRPRMVPRDHPRSTPDPISELEALAALRGESSIVSFTTTDRTLAAEAEDRWTKNPAYEPKTEIHKFGYPVEECGETIAAVGEVLAAVGKTLRWGLESTNPTLPPEEQETNRAWILRALPAIARELPDLRKAIAIIKSALERAPREGS